MCGVRALAIGEREGAGLHGGGDGSFMTSFADDADDGIMAADPCGGELVAGDGVLSFVVEAICDGGGEVFAAFADADSVVGDWVQAEAEAAAEDPVCIGEAKLAVVAPVVETRSTLASEADEAGLVHVAEVFRNGGHREVVVGVDEHILKLEGDGVGPLGDTVEIDDGAVVGVEGEQAAGGVDLQVVLGRRDENVVSLLGGSDEPEVGDVLTTDARNATFEGIWYSLCRRVKTEKSTCTGRLKESRKLN